MKKLVIISVLFISNLVFSQVIISDDIGTATNKTSVLLEFSKAENRGLLIPTVRTLPSSPTAGVMLLDGSTTNNARVRYYDGSSWVDLSNTNNPTGGNVSSFLNSQPNGAEEGKIVIGAESSSVEGVLVLESTNKAMVLPTVERVSEIVNPSPGMIVYISSKKMLAVFNGAKWSFWEAN